jgi:hypothetical protein
MGNQNAAKNSPESIEHGKKLRSEAESASHDAHEVSYGSKAVRDENGLIPVEKMTEEHHRAVAAAEKNAAEKWESVRQHAKENGNRATASIASQKRTNHNSNYWVAKKWAGEVKKFGHIQASAAVNSQSLNAGNAMTKKQHLDSCNAAMAATTTANEKNTADTHSIAASHHKIAAEHSKLMGKDDLYMKHTGMANAHDAAASRLEAASTEKNMVKAPDDYKAALEADDDAGLESRSGSLEAGGPGSGRHPGDASNVIGHAPKSSKGEPVDIGDGYLVHRHGMDSNGNHAVWVSRNGSNVRKIQTNGNLPSQHGMGGTITHESAAEIKGYHKKYIEASEAYLEKVNELSAKRMEAKAPLMAGIAGEGLSLNDLNISVREAITGLPQFASPVPNFVGCAWVADIVAPEEEKGETWTAIVQGNDQKLYAVEFTIEDESVTIVGEPKPVERVTDYDYVGEIETEAKAAMKPAVVPATAPIEAGDMSDKATKKSAAATALTAAAQEATKNAGDTKDGHTAASAAHKAAFDAHNEAYKAHAKAGSPDSVLEAHMDAMTSHKQHMTDHLAACEACQAKTAADDLTNKVHACHAELMAGGLNPSLDDLKHAVFNAHGILLKQIELAKHLSTKLEAGGPGSGPRKGAFGQTAYGKYSRGTSYGNAAAHSTDMSEKAEKDNTAEAHLKAAKAHDDAKAEAVKHFSGEDEGGNEIAERHQKFSDWHKEQATKLEAGGPGSGPRPHGGSSTSKSEATAQAMHKSSIAYEASGFEDPGGRLKQRTAEEHESIAKAHTDAGDSIKTAGETQGKLHPDNPMAQTDYKSWEKSHRDYAEKHIAAATRAGSSGKARLDI